MEPSRESTSISIASRVEQTKKDFAHKLARMDNMVRTQTDSAYLQMYKQQAAWWKSQFVAAQYENRMLKKLLDQVYGVPGRVYKQSYSRKRSKKSKKKKNRIHRKQNEENDSDESTEFVISEEFKEFLHINRLHREEREQLKAELKEARGSESESERVERMEQEPTQHNERTRREELQLLYGEEWSFIEGLETHVLMKYDQFCDRNKPSYWPNIPLNL